MNSYIENILNLYVQGKMEPTEDVKHNVDFLMQQYVDLANECSARLSRIEGMILGTKSHPGVEGPHVVEKTLPPILEKGDEPVKRHRKSAG